MLKDGDQTWTYQMGSGGMDRLFNRYQLLSLIECPPYGKDASHLLYPLFFGVPQSCFHLLRIKRKLREGVILSGGHTASQ